MTGADRPEPAAARPRMFGSTAEPVELPWSWAVDRLTESGCYWIATTRPDGRPHTRPVWGVVVDERVYVGTGSLAARNLQESNEISLHTESGTEVVILEGTAAAVDERGLVERICVEYERKYREHLEPDSLPGPFLVVEPRVAFGWLSATDYIDHGAIFHSTATRWRFDGA